MKKDAIIPLFKVAMSKQASRASSDVLQSGYIGQGKLVDEFEAAFSPYTGGLPVVAMNSCTSAIHAVLTMLNIGPGDEVITTPLTCIATNAPILAVGARPVWAGVDHLTGNIDPEDVERKLSPHTRAIMTVDWTGRPADYKKLRGFGVPVIEDAAHGPIINHEHTGDYICFSFGPIKHLTCGDGGAVAISGSEGWKVDELKLIRWYGLDRTSSADFRYAQDITTFGMKFHMNDINAAIGLANLPRLDAIVAAHQHNAKILWNTLLELPGIYVPPYDYQSNYWVFSILVEATKREEFKAFCGQRGIMVSQVHARNDKHYAYRFPCGPLPGLDRFDSTQVNLPCGWWLTKKDLERIIDVVTEFACGY